MNREIFNIAIPAIVTNVTIPLLGLLDTAIAGHLPGGSGATFIGAVAVGAMMFNLIYWNFGFLRMGTSGLTAQAYGSGDKAETVAVLQHAMAMMPVKPNPSANTAITDSTMLSTFTAMEITIGLRESCIPSSHPLIPIITSVGGAPHTPM